MGLFLPHLDNCYNRDGTHSSVNNSLPLAKTNKQTKNLTFEKKNLYVAFCHLEHIKQYVCPNCYPNHSNAFWDEPESLVEGSKELKRDPKLLPELCSQLAPLPTLFRWKRS